MSQKQNKIKKYLYHKILISKVMKIDIDQMGKDS